MTSISWTSSASGNWGNAADWSGGAIPTSTDDVTIEAGPITVTVSTSESANSVTTSGSTLSVTGGLFTVGGNASLAGAYVQSGGTAMLKGNGATFTGGLTQTGGMLDVSGNGFVSTGTVTENGGVLAIDTINTGTITAASSLSAGTIVAEGGGLIVTNAFAQSGGFLDVGGAGLFFTGNVNQSAGAILLQGASVTFEGPSDSIDGTISGRGSFVVNGGITTLNAGAVISAQLILVEQGTLALSSGFTATEAVSVGAGGHLSLGGNTLTLAGRALLGGEIGGGVANALGGGRLLNGLTVDSNSTLNIGSAFSQSGNIEVGGAALNILSGATLTLTGNDAIGNTQSLGTLTNAGLFAKTGGGRTAIVTTSFTSTGSIVAGVGAIDFDGLNNIFSGAIAGAGRVSFGASNEVQGTTDYFDNGMTLSTASALISGNSTSVYLEEKLGYAGAWQENGGTLYLDSTLALTGTAAFDGGLIKGAGTLTASGLVNLGGVDFEGDTHTDLTGQIIQSSGITLGSQSGSSPTLTIAAGATMTLEGAANVYGADGNLTNLGTLTKAGGAADIVMQGTLVNGSGAVLTIASGTLSSTGAAVLGGTITGNGVLELSGATSLSSGLSLSVGQVLISEPNNATVTLGGNLTYAGLFSQHGGTLALDGHGLTLNGGLYLDGGTLTGSGYLRQSLAATVANYSVGGQASLDLVRGGDQTGAVTIQADSVIDIGPHGTYVLDDNQSLSGGGTLLVQGTMTDAGFGLSTVSPSVVDSGLVSAGIGELRFLGSVSGTGVVTAASGGQLDFAGSVAATTGVTIAAGDTSLLLESASSFLGTITGFSAGDFIEITGLQSGAIADSWNAGDTQLTLSDASGDSFTLNFASAVNTASVTTGIGPHGYIGVYHS